MYLSQVSATVLYTILKTILLILLTQTIYSICALMNRYDLAKIFEQGNITVLIGTITSNRYKKYHSMFLCLFAAISFEIVIVLLPTIATKYMPFESVIIPIKENTYFKSKFNTPIQSVSITSNSNNINKYCKTMGLCDTNGEYYNDTLLISPSMKVNNVSFDFINSQFTNEFANVSTFYNNINDNNDKIINDTNTNLSIIISNSSSDIMSTMGFITNMQVYYYYDKYGDYSMGYDNSLLPMMYSSNFMEIISVFHQSYVVFSNGKNNLLLVTKAVTYNYPYNNDIEGINKFNKVFNNSKYLYDYIKKNNFNQAYTTYKTDNGYVAIDMVQLSNSDYGSIVTKSRFLFNLYMISDDNFDYVATNNVRPLITSYIMSHSSMGYGIIKENDSIVNNFNDVPSNDLFMYTILYSSNNSMYGIQGHREIVANISPIFICILSIIIIILIIICIIFRYKKDKIFFNTLLENIGLENLNKIYEKI